MSYSGFITKLKSVRKHSNADRLQIATCFGNEVIIGLDMNEGDLVLYFPTDGQLSMAFCEVNNLLKKKDPVTGENIGGYLDVDKRHIRTMKLRGEISDGLVCPITSLETFTDISKLKNGDLISILNKVEICTKYVPIGNKTSTKTGIQNLSEAKKVKIGKTVSYPLFKEHKATRQLAYCSNEIKEGDLCVLTLKIHGCFTSSTMIKKWGETKSTRMRYIKVGDILIGMDKYGNYVPTKVLNKIDNGVDNEDKWLKISVSRNGFRGEQITNVTCTDNHRFYKNGEYICAKDIKQFDTIDMLTKIDVSSNGEVGYLTIAQEIVDINKVDKKYHKWDLETETGNYVVHDMLVHNSSQRSMHTLKRTNEPFKGLKGFMANLLKKPKGHVLEEWDYVCGTRHTVIKGTESNGYYKGDNFRKRHHDSFVGKLYKNETVYYEVAGYTDNGASIMATVYNKKSNDKEFIRQYGESTTYSYGCEVGQSDMYIYRMTVTTDDGNVIEYPWHLIKIRAEQMGLKTCPELDVFIYTTEEDLMERVNTHLEGADPIGKTHIREGVVVRVENRETFKAYKHKGYYFKLMEGIIKDSGVTDMEELESLEEEDE